MYECSYRFSVTHCASLHWVTCVSFVQGLYAKSMLYRRMCMANTWNSWSKKGENTGNVRDAWQNPNQQEPVHLQCSSGKCCALMKRRHTDDLAELQPGQARPGQARRGQMDPCHCLIALSNSAQVTPVQSETNETWSEAPNTQGITCVHFNY